MLNAALEKESRGCTMYIFVSNDTDSLCALRIFTVSNARQYLKENARFNLASIMLCRQFCAKTKCALLPFQYFQIRT